MAFESHVLITINCFEKRATVTTVQQLLTRNIEVNTIIQINPYKRLLRPTPAEERAERGNRKCHVELHDKCRQRGLNIPRKVTECGCQRHTRKPHTLTRKIVDVNFQNNNIWAKFCDAGIDEGEGHSPTSSAMDAAIPYKRTDAVPRRSKSFAARAPKPTRKRLIKPFHKKVTENKLVGTTPAIKRSEENVRARKLIVNQKVNEMCIRNPQSRARDK